MLRLLKLLLLLLSVALVLAVPAAAQAFREHEIGVRAMAFHPGAARKVRSYEASADARDIVGGIMSQIGLPMNFDVRAAPAVPNAEALVESIAGREVRVILYNPDWMDDLRKTLGTHWSSVSILAHEIGHHLAGHVDPRYPNHAAELEADKFSGFILNKLGATLEQAQLAMAMISPEEASDTHPGRAARVAEIGRGWTEAARGGAANVIKASLTVPKLIAPSGPRVALLIGNTNYTVAEKLKNPKNDVIAVQRELRRLGFSTTTLYDATAAQIVEYVRLFREDAKDADWALFYFAGRGVEIDGVNYMMPIDVDLESDREVVRRYPHLRLDTAFAAIEPARTVRLVVADSCRIDPAHPPDASDRPPVSLVFKVVEPPRGIVVAYSTRAGTYALDGTEDLSPYAKAFIEGLRTPGMELDRVFRRVNAEVASATKGMQELRGTCPKQPSQHLLQISIIHYYLSNSYQISSVYVQNKPTN